jgi:hypothetical protein
MEGILIPKNAAQRVAVDTSATEAISQSRMAAAQPNDTSQLCLFSAAIL